MTTQHKYTSAAFQDAETVFALMEGVNIFVPAELKLFF